VIAPIAAPPVMLKVIEYSLDSLVVDLPDVLEHSRWCCCRAS
jgi:hypothetical protein